jgi:hypothetical protein
VGRIGSEGFEGGRLPRGQALTGHQSKNS